MEKKRKRARDHEPINEGQRERMWALYANHYLIQPCVASISKNILSCGIVITRKESAAKLNEDIDALIRVRYHQFVRDAVEHIAVQGFFAYHVVPSDARCGRLGYPSVVPWHAYGVKHGLNKYYELELECEAENEEGKMFRCVAPFQTTKQGLLTSPVAAASKYCLLLNDAEEHDARAYNVLSDPPVMTRTKTDHAFDNRDLVSGEVPGLAAQTEHDNLTIRNRINVSCFRDQQALIATLNDRGIDTSNRYWDGAMNPATGQNEVRDEKSYTPKFFPLPTDSEVQQIQLPRARSDMVAFRRQCFEIITTALGVPLNIVSSMSGTGVNRAQCQSEDTFAATCDFYGNTVIEVLGKVFAESFTFLKPHDVRVEFPGLKVEADVVKREAKGARDGGASERKRASEDDEAERGRAGLD